MTDLQSTLFLWDAFKAEELSGFSGAHVFLMTCDGRRWFIRKAARDRRQSERLRAQWTKQVELAASFPGLLKTPAVLNDGEIEGCFYFDMEFIRGTDGANFLRRATYSEVQHFADRLVNYLKLAAKTAPHRVSGRANLFDALFSKLCEVQQATQLIESRTLAQLFLLLERVKRQTDLQETFCHGDLTLQNLVIDDHGEIWAFDLLDAPFEHYWQDIAKLHQDLSGSWFRLHQPAIAQCVLDYMSSRVLEAATQLHSGYCELHPVLVAGAFVRILPYTTTVAHRRFVLERINYFVNLAAGSCQQ